MHEVTCCLAVLQTGQDLAVKATVLRIWLPILFYPSQRFSRNLLCHGLCFSRVLVYPPPVMKLIRWTLLLQLLTLGHGCSRTRPCAFPLPILREPSAFCTRAAVHSDGVQKDTCLILWVCAGFAAECTAGFKNPTQLLSCKRAVLTSVPLQLLPVPPLLHTGLSKASLCPATTFRNVALS